MNIGSFSLFLFQYSRDFLCFFFISTINCRNSSIYKNKPRLKIENNVINITRCCCCFFSLSIAQCVRRFNRLNLCFIFFYFSIELKLILGFTEFPNKFKYSKISRLVLFYFFIRFFLLTINRFGIFPICCEFAVFQLLCIGSKSFLLTHYLFFCCCCCLISL